MSLDFSLNLPEFKIEMDNGSKGSIYAFDDFRLDAENLMLYRGDEEISMQPKVVKTLAVLIENRGSIISKDELIEQVWSDSVVEESNLFQYLYRLRRTLGNCPDGRPYIETLKRRGFRFNGNVVCLAPPEREEPPTVAARAPSSHSGIERSGNVLRVVDWANAPELAAKVAVVEPSVAESGTADRTDRRSTLKVAALISAGAVIALVGAFFLYRSVSESRPAAAPVELSIMRLTSGVRPTNATVSPDGAFFVYDELSDDGSRMWLQQVGQTARVEIARASRMSYLGKTFTPDGKFIYFNATDEADAEPSLYRVAAIGGPQTKLVNGVKLPVSFSPDGREMVFVRESKQEKLTELVVADTDGGDQRTLVTREGRSEIIGSPAWSPDGSTIVFAVINAEGTVTFGAFGIFSIGPEGGPVKYVTKERWDNVYRIAWTFDGRGLVAIATRAGDGYSTRRNQIYFLSYPGGESRRLTTDGSWHQEASLGITSDDAILAVPFNRSSQIWAMDANGDASTAVQITDGLGDGRSGLGPIPDGRVGFIARTGDLLDIWVMNADGSERHQLTNSPQVVEELRAEAQGRFFVFSSHQEGHSHLYRIDEDGRNIKQLTFGDTQEVDSTVSPDGKWIVYQSAIPNLEPALMRIPADGGEPQRFGDSPCMTPSYSPSGDLLSCIRDGEIVVLSGIDGSEVNSFKILPFARVNSGAKWSPDGRALAYIRTDKGFSNLWIQPLDRSEPRELTTFTSGRMHNFAFSTDGSRLFVARGHEIQDAILIRNYR